MLLGKLINRNQVQIPNYLDFKKITDLSLMIIRAANGILITFLKLGYQIFEQALINSFKTIQ